MLLIKHILLLCSYDYIRLYSNLPHSLTEIFQDDLIMHIKLTFYVTYIGFHLLINYNELKTNNQYSLTTIWVTSRWLNIIINSFSVRIHFNFEPRPIFLFNLVFIFFTSSSTQNYVIVPSRINHSLIFSFLHRVDFSFPPNCFLYLEFPRVCKKNHILF